MAKTAVKLWNGRKVKVELTFNKNKGTFQNMYAAETFLRMQGYSYGSTCDGPVAVMKGEYSLPQKWHNLKKEDKLKVDAVIVSEDWREGPIKIIFFEI